MATKIVFRNNSGAITIDGTYKNLQYHSKSTITAGAVQKLPLVSTMPNMWALASTGGIQMCPSYNNPQVSYDRVDVWSVVGTGERFEFCDKDFVRADPGINIYHETSGVLVFSSNIKPMRVVDAISGVANMSNGVVLLEKTYNTVRNYAVVMGSIPVRMWAGSNIETLCPRIQTSNGHVKISLEKMTQSTAGSYRGTLQSPTYNFLVVDVTGY